MYFPEHRVALACARQGLVAGDSMDILTGNDFDNAADRSRANKPRVLIGSPPCTMFTTSMRWNRIMYGDRLGWEDWCRRELERHGGILHVAASCTKYKSPKGCIFFTNISGWQNRGVRITCRRCSRYLESGWYVETCVCTERRPMAMESTDLQDV